MADQQLLRGKGYDLAHRIGLAILNAEYPPGFSFNATDLQSELALSRSVIREAVKILESKGMLTARPNSGTRVLPISSWNLLDRDIVGWLAASTDPYGLAAEAKAFAAVLAEQSELTENRFFLHASLTLLNGGQ